MINFTGLLAIRGASNSTYINTKNIEKIQDANGRALVTYTSGNFDTFELSANNLANKFNEMEIENKPFDEINDDTAPKSVFI